MRLFLTLVLEAESFLRKAEMGVQSVVQGQDLGRGQGVGVGVGMVRMVEALETVVMLTALLSTTTLQLPSR